MARTSATQKLGKRVKQIRLEHGLTQERLAIAAGLSQTYLSGVESGSRNPSIKTLSKIAKALKVELRDLTDYEAGEHSRQTNHL
jgi:transcriptional regulator with XRE-family HTH domain